MVAFVVLEPPPGQAATGEDAAASAELVRDGFTIVGFLVPVFWLLWQRLWIEALLALCLTVLLAVAAERLGMGFAGSLLSLLVSLYVGLEGQALRVAARRRRGWRDWGVVEADSVREAEARYLIERLGFERRDPPAEPRSPAAGQPTPALGLLAYPGTR